MITILEKLGFKALVEQTVTSKRIPRAMDLLKVTKLPVQSTFWRFVNGLHLNVARQILAITRTMRERVWATAKLKVEVVTLDTDTTVHTLYGQQKGGRKSYNPKNKGKKSYQRMSSEGWCIQWESSPPGQESESCSLDSRAEGN